MGAAMHTLRDPNVASVATWGCAVDTEDETDVQSDAGTCAKHRRELMQFATTLVGHIYLTRAELS